MYIKGSKIAPYVFTTKIGQIPPCFPFQFTWREADSDLFDAQGSRWIRILYYNMEGWLQVTGTWPGSAVVPRWDTSCGAARRMCGGWGALGYCMSKSDCPSLGVDVDYKSNTVCGTGEICCLPMLVRHTQPNTQPVPRDYTCYQKKYAYLRKLDPSWSRPLTQPQRITLYLYATEGGANAADLAHTKFGAYQDSAMVIWWALNDGFPDPFSWYYQCNCADESGHQDYNRDCIPHNIDGNYQIGYACHINCGRK